MKDLMVEWHYLSFFVSLMGISKSYILIFDVLLVQLFPINELFHPKQPSAKASEVMCVCVCGFVCDSSKLPVNCILEARAALVLLITACGSAFNNLAEKKDCERKFMEGRNKEKKQKAAGAECDGGRVQRLDIKRKMQKRRKNRGNVSIDLWRK